MRRILRLGLGLGLATLIAAAAATTVSASSDEQTRQQWVQSYDTLRDQEKGLREKLEKARAQYSRGRRANRLRGEERAEVVEEIEKLEKELEKAQRDLAAFPEKAREAGALPGWFRDR
jgi:peptidoglycan hydrolase CwlO-like protein